MKYVLVDNFNNVIDTKDLSDDVGVKGATTFFVKRKQIPYESFIQIWRVMSETEYKRLKVHEETLKEYEEFGDWLDIEKS